MMCEPRSTTTSQSHVDLSLDKLVVALAEAKDVSKRRRF